MNILEAVRMAMAALYAHKLRSLLTLLGVIIGVMTVIAVLTIINGLNNYVSQKVSLLGRDSFIVTKQGMTVNVDDLIEAKNRKDLTFADLAAVRANCTSCDLVGGGQTTFVTIKFGREFIRDTFLRAHMFETPRILNVEIATGRQLSEQDVEHSRPVAILGADVVDNLFPQVDPIGREVKIDGYPFRVIGVAKRVGKAFGQSQDNFTIIPLTVYRKLYGTNESIMILGRARRPELLEQAKDEARAILRARQHTPYPDKDGFSIVDSQTFIGLWQQFTGVFFIVTIAISSISLVVGGIVIMNIMLVTVTERTREIGVRKAVGARRRDILRQFLVEAVTVSMVGGLCGVLCGFGIAAAVSPFLGAPAEVTPTSITLGLGMSVLVGLCSGIYPAWKAARLDPIAALRFEM